MSNIRELDLKNLKHFLLINNVKIPKYDDDIYDKAFELMGKKTSVYDDKDISIIEWMLAYNALKRKVINKIYHIDDIDNMSGLELSKLAKSLGMLKPNISSIINILRFMHKFDTKGERETITGVYDFDNVLLKVVEPKDLDNLILNNYLETLLNDQKFWKDRLEKRLGLSSNKKLDFKFITKFLDNGKSFEENYQSALKLKLKDVIDILRENNVVMIDKPNVLLEDVSIAVDELGDIKNYSYSDFINYILNKTNEILIDLEEEPIDISYFDKKVYTGDAIIIEIPNALHDPFDEKSGVSLKIILKNKKGFTNGEILYQLAQKIPNEDEIKEYNIEIIRKHPDDILQDIKNHFIYLEEEMKKPRHSEFLKTLLQKRFNTLKKYYNIIVISHLLKDPINFLKYTAEHPSEDLTDYNSTDLWGNHVYWEGLYYDDDMYRLSLGS